MKTKEELTTGEAANAAGIKRQTLLSWIRAGKLAGIVRKQPVGLFRTDYILNAEKFMNWIESNTPKK